MNRFAIGVDLGGTNLKLGAIDEGGTLLEKIEINAETQNGPSMVVKTLCKKICELKDRWRQQYKLAGIGVGIAGIMKLDEGRVITAPNLPGWEGFPVRSKIEEGIRTSFMLENDGNVAALGEKWMGAGRNAQHLAFLTLGTGIGGGLILDGKIWHGISGMAAEFGHVTIYPDGNLCNCGNYGCLEAYASATAIVRGAKTLVKTNEASLKIKELVLSRKTINAESIYELAKLGDPSSIELFNKMGTALGIAIAGFIHIFDIDKFVLGGGAIASWDVFKKPMLHEVQNRSFVQRADPRNIYNSELGSNAGIYGAGCLAFQKTLI